MTTTTGTHPASSAGTGSAAPTTARPQSNRAATGALIDCPQCRRPMHHLVLPGHIHPTKVIVDHCRPCGLVWFDAMESVQLSSIGWIQLLRELTIGAQANRPEAAKLACPICQVTLKPVQNRSRYGRFPALECIGCRGHLHSQAGMLAERGLVRPLLPAERNALQSERRQLCCLNCGAPSDGRAEHCTYCTTPLLMVDLPRLTHALRRRKQGEPLLAPSGGQAVAWACRGCGAPVDPSRQTHCTRCEHAVVVTSLAELGPMLDALEQEWRQEQAWDAADRAVKRDSYRMPLRPTRSSRQARRDGEEGYESYRETDVERIRRWWLSDEHGTPYSVTELVLGLLLLLVAYWFFG